MLLLNEEVEAKGLFRAAEQLCLAARTAPKGKGMDLLVTAVVDGEDKDRLTEKMREIAERDGVAFFSRDAGNVEGVVVLVLLGTRKEPLGLPHCGFCGFTDCGAMQKAGATCSFNTGDLGIALGSAVSRAADLRVDNRIMYSAGKAALELGLLGPDVAIAYGIPLSATGKSPFFDRG
ncbi:MAG: ferredoxin [Desulfuromonas sp.]|uniref:ferredoxin domain-containing protein n=1 Tax=Desulfuromonas sp. TaxID=892 RepID=UPI000CAF75E3|nr:DUF2148 domain-containing protein [Desulfuromonas sp.]PLX83359.1 MAG: ferredoxin [Desulfuromonas sp.]